MQSQASHQKAHPSDSASNKSINTETDKSGGIPHLQDNQLKTYFFESETKRLKAYYSQRPQQLLGRKILFNNSVALVRYFGELKHEGRPKESENQLWVGVEWDEDDRGKHNGTVNGYQYFQTIDKKGSLLKFQKIEFGYKLETALFKRYFRAEELHHAKNLFDTLRTYKEELKEESEQVKEAKCQEMLKKKVHKIEYDSEAYVQTLKKSKRIMIQFVGFDEIWSKINNLDKLVSISLAECRICDFGPAKHLNNLLSNLQILSLQDNLLSHWDQIYQLGLELPHITQLSVAYNILAPPEENYQHKKYIKIVGHHDTIPLPETKIFPKLKCLILIGTGLTWKTLFKVMKAIDGIEELIICKNDLRDTDNIDTGKFNYLQNLKTLNLEQTQLESFDGIRKFGILQKLQKLTLNKNKIKVLGRDLDGFKNLKSLSIQYNLIDNPVVLYEISQFPELEALNMKHNPMSDKLGNAHIRMRAVAELPKLKFINGAMLKKYQRKDCEIYYMRESFREYFAFKNVPDYDYDYEDFMKYCQGCHPNVSHLIKRYGNPYQVEEKKQIKKIIQEEVKTNELKKGTGMVQAFIQIKGEEKVKKKLPLSWTLSSLRNFIAKTMKIPVGMQKLTCRIDESSPEQEMVQDHKPLNYYNLRSDSLILIEKVN